MNATFRDEEGSASVLAIVLLPVLLLSLAGVLEFGALHVLAARARSAADLAVVVAVNDQDDEEFARSGRLRLAADAESVARAYFATNLEGIGAALGQSASAIAAAADVAVYPDAPSVDSRFGTLYDHPTVRLAADVPLRAPVLAALLGQGTVSVGIRAASSAR